MIAVCDVLREIAARKTVFANGVINQRSFFGQQISIASLSEHQTFKRFNALEQRANKHFTAVYSNCFSFLQAEQPAKQELTDSTDSVRYWSEHPNLNPGYRAEPAGESLSCEFRC